MPAFKFVGTDAQEAELGSVHEFDEDPHDSRWVAVDAPAAPEVEPEPAQPVEEQS
jgi:hypothetical protein